MTDVHKMLEHLGKTAIVIFLAHASPALAAPDLNGFWMRDWAPPVPPPSAQRGQRPQPGPGQRPPGGPTGQRAQLTEEARRVAEAYDPLVDDPAFECSPASLSRFWVEPLSPLEIIQEEDRVIIRHEFMDTVRTIPLSRPGERGAAAASVLGNSIGWYEDQTLVIDTVGFTPSYISTVQGIRQTERLHTIERLTPTDNGGFTVAITFEDTTTLVTPWTNTLSFMPSPGGREPLEYGCIPEEASYN